MKETRCKRGQRKVPDALVGATIDERYEILSLIGEGNRATVYLAKHLMLNKLVALKLFK